ncbi:MAG: hypothetical protein ACHQ52_14930 [Candidatus Eisenbacteria bacterium]
MAPEVELKGEIMRNHTCISLSAALVLLVTAIPVANTRADSRTPHGRMVVRHDDPSFNASGEFTGSLDSEILMDGVTYHLSPDATVYEIGSGFVAMGSMVSDRHIFLAGMGSVEDGQVTLIIIRPASDTYPDRNAPEGQVGIRDDASPQ